MTCKPTTSRKPAAGSRGRCSRSGVAISDIGLDVCQNAATTIITANVAMASPVITIAPKIDEAQGASSDITQSIAENVLAANRITVPGPLNRCSRRLGRWSLVWSCRLDQPASRNASAVHTPK